MKSRLRSSPFRPSGRFLSGRFPPNSETGRLVVRQWLRRGLHQVFLRFVPFSLAAAHLEIGRSDRAWRPPMWIGLTVCIHDAEIVLRVLIQIFGCDPVAARRRFTGERHIAFEHLVSIATDLHVRTIAVKSLDPVRHSRTVMVRVVTVVATARAFVWSWSHDTCLIAVYIIGPLSGGSIPLAPLGRIGRVLRFSSRHRAPERRQPRRDRGVFQPFSAVSSVAAGDARSHSEQYRQGRFRYHPRPSRLSESWRRRHLLDPRRLR